MDLVKGERIAIVGLGGVGAWVAELDHKADVAEIHGWGMPMKLKTRMSSGCRELQTPDCIGKPKARWLEETYREIYPQVLYHLKDIDKQTAAEMCANTTFGFVAVDNDESRKTACTAMAEAANPFY